MREVATANRFKRISVDSTVVVRGVLTVTQTAITLMTNVVSGEPTVNNGLNMLVYPTISMNIMAVYLDLRSKLTIEEPIISVAQHTTDLTHKTILETVALSEIRLNRIIQLSKLLVDLTVITIIAD